MTSVRNVEILALGDELLLGIRANSHLEFLGESLAGHGLRLRRSHELPDDPEIVREAFAEAWARADLIITTGGLGPTKDDLTRETIAAVLGRELVHSEEQESILRAYFEKRGYAALTENNLRQCLGMAGGEFIKNDNGTAPGQWFAEDGKLLIMLPGPPRELRPMYLQEVLPRLIREGWARPREKYLQLRTSGLGESQLATDLEPIFEEYEGRLQVAYCAHEGSVDVRLSPLGDALDDAAIRELGERVKERLGTAFSHYGEDDLAAHVLDVLRSRGRKLAVAESCTGGLLASRFTDIPGASDVFLGGLVCYRSYAKEALLDIPQEVICQHGAVSPEVAMAMAEAAAQHFETDYGVSITGYAGPEDGPDAPAGTIYLGLSTPMGVWSCKLYRPGTRASVKVRAVNGAIDFLRRKLQQYEVHDLLDRLCV
jgi:nicotinamide-nucleotide amidase